MSTGYRPIENLKKLPGAFDYVRLESSSHPNDAIMRKDASKMVDELGDKLQSEIMKYITGLVDEAPEGLDTLRELAELLKKNEDGVAGIVNALGEIKKRYTEEDEAIRSDIQKLSDSLKSAVESNKSAISEHEKAMGELKASIKVVTTSTYTNSQDLKQLRSDLDRQVTKQDKEYKQVSTDLVKSTLELQKLHEAEQKLREEGDDREAKERIESISKLTQQATDFKSEVDKRITLERDERTASDKAQSSRIDATGKVIESNKLAQEKGDAALAEKINTLAKEGRDSLDKEAAIRERDDKELKAAFAKEIEVKGEYHTKALESAVSSIKDEMTKNAEVNDKEHSKLKETLDTKAERKNAVLEAPTADMVYIGPNKHWAIVPMGEHDEILTLRWRQNPLGPFEAQVELGNVSHLIKPIVDPVPVPMPMPVVMPDIAIKPAVEPKQN